MDAVKMRDGFRIGTIKFHAEPNMNYQFNRIMSLGGAAAEVLTAVAARVRGLDDWVEEFLELARTAEADGDGAARAAYLRAALFYLEAGDSRKSATYRAYRDLVMELHRDDFTSGRIDVLETPYGKGRLPIWHAKPAAGRSAEKPPAVLFHLGYDSLKEEVLPVLKLMADRGLDVWLFEGPGQGEPLHDQGMTMTPEWEKPVGAVLDFLGLDDVTIVGLSLGGYLAPRAAVHDRRIARVVAWGVLWDFYETVVTRRGPGLARLIGFCRVVGARPFLNAIVRAKMRRDSYTRWGVGHGMLVTGAADPWEYFEALRRYSMKSVSGQVRQDFLLLAGAEDHFIPASHFTAQIAALANVRSLTARLFTKAEGAENHVQFGNIPLAVDTIAAWIRERSAG